MNKINYPNFVQQAVDTFKLAQASFRLDFQLDGMFTPTGSTINLRSYLDCITTRKKSS